MQYGGKVICNMPIAESIEVEEIGGKRLVIVEKDIHRSMEVGYWCTSYASSCDVQCSVLHPLQYFHARLRQAVNKAPTDIGQYKSDELPVKGPKGLLEVAERRISLGLHDVQQILQRP